MRIHKILVVVGLGLGLFALGACGPESTEPSEESSQETGSPEPGAAPEAYIEVITQPVDCSSLSKGGSCGSHGGVDYCRWCPAEGCDQSGCVCLANRHGTGCN
jgi:hypothetical protein